MSSEFTIKVNGIEILSIFAENALIGSENIGFFSDKEQKTIIAIYKIRNVKYELNEIKLW